MCKLCLSKFFFIKTPFDTFKTPKGLQGQRPSRLCAPCPRGGLCHFVGVNVSKGNVTLRIFNAKME